jgi:hypothetical protein
VRKVLWVLPCIVAVASSAHAVQFLGVELCAGSVDTSVVLPVGSELALESAEIGRHGGLLLLLTATTGDVMDHIDTLMAEATGVRGSGDAKKLRWSGNSITAYAQVIKEGYAALAVSTTDTCRPAKTTPGAKVKAGEAEGEGVATTARASEPAEGGTATATPPVENAAAPAATTAVTVGGAAATAPVEEAPAGEPALSVADFALKGRLKHAAADGGWVDVMGVVVNSSGAGYAVASFDLSLYDEAGEMVCVDTISVNQLRAGQERAFRGAIRCPDYAAGQVASWKLQFAGGR